MVPESSASSVAWLEKDDFGYWPEWIRELIVFVVRFLPEGDKFWHFG